MIVMVVGASGASAGSVVRELTGLGVTVRGMVRDECRVEEARRHGAAETFVADLKEPASLRRAVEGADGVFHLNPAFAVDEAGMGVAMVRAVAARSFVEDRCSHGTFELAAEGMVDRTELAALVEKAIGRPVEATTPSFEAWAGAAGLPAGPLRDGLERMNAHYDQHGFHGGNALVLRSLLGREPRTLTAYVDELASGRDRPHADARGAAPPQGRPWSAPQRG